jgi:hypothetical protein
MFFSHSQRRFSGTQKATTRDLNGPAAMLLNTCIYNKLCASGIQEIIAWKERFEHARKTNGCSVDVADSQIQAYAMFARLNLGGICLI